MKSIISVAITLFCCSFVSDQVIADEKPTTEQIEFFEKRIRPLLTEHCFRCHSTKAKRLRAGLKLDSKAAMLKGGESGTAIVAAHPEKSLLIKAVRFGKLQMPPSGKLPQNKIDVLVKWVKMGAPWPESKTPALAVGDKKFDWQKARESHWAWRPVTKPKLPVIIDRKWVKNSVDHFILARLETNGMKPARPANKRTLLRRAYFDLIGLPPTPKEVVAFVNDDDPDAFAKVVDRLLASPQYGERWARHWLDIARYSDGYGGFLDNAALPNAWRYRDWVVRAFNNDMPYDEFIKQQIAGDLMGKTLSDVGPGFFAVGPTYKSDGGDADSVAQAKSETLDDRIDTLSRGVLALTVSCARCHDHKFDPITVFDYYALAGVFNNTRNVKKPFAPANVVAKYNQAQKAIANLDRKIKQFQGNLRKAKRKPNAEEKTKLVQWQKQLGHLRKTAPPRFPEIHTLADSGSRDMPIALRGNLRKPGAIAPRRFLRILSNPEARRFSKGSGRLELANAVGDPKNPLTARVMVNRVWLQHFGKALVRTPSNFGTLGETPTHPKLLDWLADHFVASGWSIKKLHRTIMLSATYQMSTAFDERNYKRDGDNRLTWRMNPRRLDVEAYRDALLAVSGELDDTVGGPPERNILQSKRRTLYTIISRNADKFATDEFLRMFDFPNPRVTSPKRTTSITPQQYLFMLNSPFVRARAKSLVARLSRETTINGERIGKAYMLLYGRAPTKREIDLGLAFLDKGMNRWEQYAQILLCANEFLFIQ